ncbi:MAG: hypothetical protein IIV43_01210, partial [Oscillospiraceae bacterium]|nr:hypothetical protein [Oscillospiraceae bacterium]
MSLRWMKLRVIAIRKLFWRRQIAVPDNNERDREAVWPTENMFDFPLSVLTNAKVARNKAKRAGNAGVGNTIPYTIYDDE